MNDEKSDRDAKQQQRKNQDRMEQCLKLLRKYLESLSESAEIDARRHRLEEQREEIHKEERMMREEQYPTDDGFEMWFEQDFQFEWM